MKCSNCNKTVKKKKIPEYHLDTVGLPNVWLINIEGYDCENCGNKGIFLPNYGQLMTTISQAVIFKDESFNSQEIKFLRNFFGLKNKDIAKRVGTNEKTVSFWITGKSKVSPAYGIKLRQAFISSFESYVKKNHEELKSFIKEIKQLKKMVYKAVSEPEILKKIRGMAKDAAKAKIQEATIYAMANSEDLVLTIPNTKSGVALRH